MTQLSNLFKKNAAAMLHMHVKRKCRQKMRMSDSTEVAKIPRGATWHAALTVYICATSIVWITSVGKSAVNNGSVETLSCWTRKQTQSNIGVVNFAFTFICAWVCVHSFQHTI